MKKIKYIVVFIIVVLSCKQFNAKDADLSIVGSLSSNDTILIEFENSYQFEHSNNLIVQIIDKSDSKKIKCKKKVESTTPFETIKVSDEIKIIKIDNSDIGFAFFSIKLYDGEYFELYINYIQNCQLFSITQEISYIEDNNNSEDILKNFESQLHMLPISNPEKKLIVNYLNNYISNEKYKYSWVEKHFHENLKEKSDLKPSSDWKGVYWYFPYETKDSLGSYYVNIQDDYLDFGFSGHDNYNFKIDLKTYNDSVVLFKINNNIPFGTIYKKNDKFWLKSDLVKIKKQEDLEKELVLLNYAKSSDDIE